MTYELWKLQDTSLELLVERTKEEVSVLACRDQDKWILLGSETCEDIDYEVWKLDLLCGSRPGKVISENELYMWMMEKEKVPSGAPQHTVLVTHFLWALEVVIERIKAENAIYEAEYRIWNR